MKQCLVHAFLVVLISLSECRRPGSRSGTAPPDASTLGVTSPDMTSSGMTTLGLLSSSMAWVGMASDASSSSAASSSLITSPTMIIPSVTPVDSSAPTSAAGPSSASSSLGSAADSSSAMPVEGMTSTTPSDGSSTDAPSSLGISADDTSSLTTNVLPFSDDTTLTDGNVRKALSARSGFVPVQSPPGRNMNSNGPAARRNPYAQGPSARQLPVGQPQSAARRSPPGRPPVGPPQPAVPQQPAGQPSDLKKPEWAEEIRDPGQKASRQSDMPPEGMVPAEACNVETTSEDERDAIVTMHNSLRRKVATGKETLGYANEPQPQAKNMMEMGYNNALEKMAAQWAQTCNQQFDLNYNIDNFTSIWQAVLYQSSYKPIPKFNLAYAAYFRYYTTVTRFYGPDAVQPFYGYNSLTKQDVRPYAILVNHDTRGIGCAQATYYNSTEFKYYRIAICNYGNGFKVGDSLYDSGDPCQDVADNFCDDGLVVLPPSL